ncbi:MoxR family ATPase [Bradyrhizobium sp. CW10]|uniref:AAA family ATPase n=1 Tax=Bradyrhizobium sp. CW10 TaxID=2782683 RepID=UPI001FF7483D|nr:MoxR family ATPase [Bradyrhizobium sp. CW10]MCK1472846.1 MoxR family ATPase [Bradyrhizobium sp. CW10]
MNSTQDAPQTTSEDEIRKIDPLFFGKRDGAFPDARTLRSDSEKYSKLYHTVENWEGLRRWKNEKELKDIEDHYYGRDTERRYLWLDELDRHMKLSGKISGPQVDDNDNEEAINDKKAYAHGSLASFLEKARQHISNRYPGTNILEAFDAIFIGLMFGRHVYVEGSSGIGKTQIVRELCSMLSLPYQQYDAYADATDLSLLGGEVPVSLNDSIAFSFERGPLLTPGLLGLVIDELPRLPASTSNVLLQAMAERKVSVSLVASGRGAATVLLSPHFIVIGTGNPVGYGGQGERSFALFDRFDIGIEMKHPGLQARRQILVGQAASGSRNEFTSKPNFTLSVINALVREVCMPSIFFPILITAAYALGPKEFLRRTETENPGWLTSDSIGRFGKSSDEADQMERVMWEAARVFTTKHKDDARRLAEMVEENLTEGSNPRGEISVVNNAKALALVRHPSKATWTVPQVYLDDLGQAFHWANYARLKTYPGAEGQRGALLDAATALFFDSRKWISIVEALQSSSSDIRGKVTDELRKFSKNPAND